MNFLPDVTLLDTRLYLFMGEDDHTTPVAQVREWFGLVEATTKQLKVVAAAAHLAPLEQIPAFLSLIADVRRAVTAQSGIGGPQRV